jgi:hypothetical protein
MQPLTMAPLVTSPSPQSQRTPLLPLPLPSSPATPMAASHGAQVRSWPPPMKNLNQAHFSSWDNQNGCAWPSLAISALNFIQNQL